jgi:hypothetical protein
MPLIHHEYCTHWYNNNNGIHEQEFVSMFNRIEDIQRTTLLIHICDWTSGFKRRKIIVCCEGGKFFGAQEYVMR